MKKSIGLIASLLLAVSSFGQNIINSEWIDVPFGLYDNAYSGGSIESAGTITVIGSGSSMWSTDSDGGRFVYKPVSGDCDLIATVQKPAGDGLSEYARTGLMMRESNDRAREYASFIRQRGTGDGGIIQQLTRLAFNQNPASNNSITDTNAFTRMRLIRRGNTFLTYAATGTVDTAWTFVSSRNLALGETLNAGVFVCVHTSSAQNLMTNDFKDVSANVIVGVSTNATGGADISWLTDLPYLPTNTCLYSYSVTRTALDGSETVVATDLSANSYSDNTLTQGAYYRYSVDAKELPYLPQAVTGTVYVGSSALFRHQAATTNLVSGIAPGLTVAYYDTKDSAAPYAVSNATSLAAILNPTGGETTDFKSVVDACIYVDETDLYTFFLELDDSAEISIDGRIILQNWSFGGDRQTASAPVLLEKGRSHAFRALFAQGTGGRKFTLKWNRSGDPDTVTDVPDSAFTPVPAGYMTTAIGDMKLNGNTIFDTANNTITIVAGGGPAKESTDSGRAVLSAVGTSIDLSTCLTSLTSNATHPMAGLTLRNDFAVDSAGLSLMAVGGYGNWVLMAATRSIAGTDMATTNLVTAIPETDPLCLRITQNGGSYTLLYKTGSATAWSAFDTFDLELEPSALCGIAALSDNFDEPATAIFKETGLVTDNITKLLPTDDTYVQSDNSLRGGEGVITLKHRGLTTMREGLMRFNLGSISSLNSATLRLVVSSRDSGYANQDVNLRVHHNMQWNEGTLRWNTPPAGLRFPTVFMDYSDPTLLARFPTHFTGEVIDIDVTEAVQQSIDGTGDLTFTLSATVSIDPGLSFHSKEAADSNVRPCLIITTDSPYGLEASGSIETGKIDLEWSAYPSAESYTIYRAASSGGAYSQVASGITETSYTDSGLTPGSPYFYKVAAVTDAGITALSAAADARATAAVSSQTASEDSFVEGGTDANKNWNGTTLTCKSNYNNYNYHREPYFKFDDISGLGHAQKVFLRLVPQNASVGSGTPIDPSTIPVNFIRMPDNTWDETTVTWNNHPIDYPPPTAKNDNAPESDRVTQVATPKDVPMLIDVTEIVRKAALVNADDKLSIGALRLDSSGGFNLVFYASEATTASYRPQLLAADINRPILPEPETGGGYPALMWDDYPSATAYNIYRATSKEGPFTLITNTTDTAFNDFSCLSGEVYFYKLTAVTGGSETETSLPVVAAFNFEETRYPVADTGVDSQNLNVNYGSDTTVNLKWSPAREQLFKFDVRGLENITRARFRINPSPGDAAYKPVNIRLWKGDYGDWNEHAVKYNTAYRPFNYAPQQSDTANLLATINIEYKEIDGANRLLYAEADVTDAIRDAAQAGMKYLTLVFTGDPAAQDAKGMMYTAMREYGVEKNRPVLILSGSTFTPPEGLIAEETVTLATESGVTLTWRPVAGADHYVVTRTGPDGIPVVIADNLTGSTYSDISTTFRNTGEYTYTVTAVNGDGSELSSSAVVELNRTMTRPVLQDTFVRSRSYSNDVYGAGTAIEVKRDQEGPNTDFNRVAFVQISATNNPEFARAQLRLVLKSVNIGTMTLYATERDDETWNEATANWISLIGPDFSSPAIPAPNDPALLDYIEINPYAVGDEVLIDITDNLRTAKARGDEFFSLMIFGGTAGSQSNYSFWTKEHANFEYAPHVIYTVPSYPRGGTLIILR